MKIPGPNRLSFFNERTIFSQRKTPSDLDDSLYWVKQDEFPNMYIACYALDKATQTLFADFKNPMFFSLLDLTRESIMILFSSP
jgi:hypothetical protein